MTTTDEFLMDALARHTPLERDVGTAYHHVECQECHHQPFPCEQARAATRIRELERQRDEWKLTAGVEADHGEEVYQDYKKVEAESAERGRLLNDVAVALDETTGSFGVYQTPAERIRALAQRTKP